jgi:hypothetical protein
MCITATGIKPKAAGGRFSGARRCSFCGGPPSRRRCGKVGRVRCCVNCGVYVLPRLLLDAIEGGEGARFLTRGQIETGIEAFAAIYHDRAAKTLAGGVGYRTEETA